MGIDPRRFKGSGQEKAWLDWLGDESTIFHLPERLKHHGKAQSTEPVKSSQDLRKPSRDQHTVAINITVPKFHFGREKLAQYREKLPNWPYKRLLAIGVAIVVLGGGVLIGLNVFGHKKPKEGQGVLSGVSQKPDYKYVLPEGKESETQGGKIAYSPQRKVVSYTDTIGGVQVTVSQQPLPEGFKEGTDDKVKKMAADFAATEVISESTPTAYLGTSVKGPQTVIFHKNGLLIFIQSVSNIDKHDWAEYITKLK